MQPEKDYFIISLLISYFVCIYFIMLILFIFLKMLWSALLSSVNRGLGCEWLPRSANFLFTVEGLALGIPFRWNHHHQSRVCSLRCADHDGVIRIKGMFPDFEADLCVKYLPKQTNKQKKLEWMNLNVQTGNLFKTFVHKDVLLQL